MLLLLGYLEVQRVSDNYYFVHDWHSPFVWNYDDWKSSSSDFGTTITNVNPAGNLNIGLPSYYTGNVFIQLSYRQVSASDVDWTPQPSVLTLGRVQQLPIYGFGNGTYPPGFVLSTDAPTAPGAGSDYQFSAIFSVVGGVGNSIVLNWFTGPLGSAGIAVCDLFVISWPSTLTD